MDKLNLAAKFYRKYVLVVCFLLTLVCIVFLPLAFDISAADSPQEDEILTCLSINSNIVNLTTKYAVPPNFATFTKFVGRHFIKELLLADQKLISCFTDGGKIVSNCKKMLSNPENYELWAETKCLSKFGRSSTRKKGPFEVDFVTGTIQVEYNSTKFLIRPLEIRDHYWFIAGSEKFKLDATAIPKCRMNEFYIPSDVGGFLRVRNVSRFVKCQQDISADLRKKYADLYTNYRIPLNKGMANLVAMRDLLMSIGIRPFLHGGTLLGWYRDCGLIPYTTDMDLAAWHFEYSKKLEKKLKWNTRFSLVWILGKPDDSLEYTVFAKSIKANIDLFFMYDQDANNTSTSYNRVNPSWTGGMHGSDKLRWIYPPMSNGLCSADLLGHLFNVPCDVEQFLEADYGRNWAQPWRQSKFTWFKSHSNVRKVGRWTRNELRNVFRSFF